MCGIAGFFAGRSPAPQEMVLGRMLKSLRHRGPDDEGAHVDVDLALGARRLSVIDLRSGHQPMANEDGTVWVVQNGEIYNYRLLRDVLRARGHRFRTESDTEVIVHAYEEYGHEFPAHLEGMFALAVWDMRARTLVLARDRMGEKPLHYYASQGTFVFASEFRALLEHPDVPRELSLPSLSRYLAFHYVPSPGALLDGLAKLPPGHMLTVTPGAEPRVSRYWDIPFAPDPTVDEREWPRRLRTQLEASVRRQLVSDVPLGMFLSGGLDSSAIVAIAARLTGGRLRTFNVVFDEGSYDERRYARMVAERYGTEHTEIPFSGSAARALMDDVGGLLDEPLVIPPFLAGYVLSREARRAVTVVLSGEGSDELFCGYATFLAERTRRFRRMIPGWLGRAASRAADQLRPNFEYGSVEYLIKQFLRTLPFPAPIRTQVGQGGLIAAEQAALLTPRVRQACAGLDLYEDLTRVMGAVADRAPLERLIYQHCKFYLAEQNLVSGDRSSMASGLEVRTPFLDVPLVELAGRIPSDLKLHGWTPKYVLKQAMMGDLPAEILGRYKQGFSVPVGHWLRGPLRETLTERLGEERISRLGLFEPLVIRRLVAEHLEGRRDHAMTLWALLMFDAWRDYYLPHARWT